LRTSMGTGLNTFKHPSTFFQQHSIKGFLASHEGEALFEYAGKAKAVGPCLEIGSYCGKSTVYIGLACKDSGNTLYAVDHHRGSEEHQLGEEYHDQALYDHGVQQMDSLPCFRETLKLAQLEDTVIPVVASSALALRHWQTPLGFAFIDGGHSPQMAMDDCTGWAEKIAPGGLLAIHDIFERPEDGGQGPYLGMQAVLNSGKLSGKVSEKFITIDRIDSLAILQRQ